MTNPRLVYGREGIGYRAATYAIDGTTITFAADQVNGSAVAGRAVGLVAGTANMVELVVAGQDILGRLDNVAGDGACTVQIEGQAFLPAGNAVTLVRGDKIVGALGAAAARGFIGPADGTSGATALAGRHRIDDTTTATAIDVYLGV
jgi:hypothetical protein